MGRKARPCWGSHVAQRKFIRVKGGELCHLGSKAMGCTEYCHLVWVHALLCLEKASWEVPTTALLEVAIARARPEKLGPS
eukprot:473121-Amphidinium_carterae.1